MHLDVTTHKGSPDRPVVIFIHGLGVDKNFWVDPVETKILAGSVAMRVFAATRPRPCFPPKGRTKRGGFMYKKLTIGNIPEKIDNLWTVLLNKGFNVICWSQKRPVGPINIAVEELDEIVNQAKQLFPGKPIALVGHSRGGLIARKFMEKNVPEVKAMVTISTPHAGSSLSRFGQYLAPISALLKNLLPQNTHGTVSRVIKSVNELIQGNALKELLPGSDFFKNLRDSPSGHIRYVSFGGISTKLLTVYRWKRQDGKMHPEPFLTIPDSLIKVLPASVIPDEVIPGRGDVMVTAESSRLPWAEKHYDLPANHISITWHRKVIETTIEALDQI